MAHLDKSVAIVGAGDYIGTAIAKKFASFGALEALFHREKRPDKQGGGV